MSRIIKLDAKTIANIRASKHFDAAMKEFHGREDAVDLAIYATRQLMYLEQKVHQKVEADLTGLLVFPTTYAGHRGIDSVAVKTSEATGTAQQISKGGKDFKRVEEGEEEDIFPAINYGLEYGVNMDEIEQGNFTGRNVSDRKALRASRGMDEGVNTCLWKGDGRLPGLFSSKVIGNLTDATSNFSNKIRNLTVDNAKTALKNMKAQANAVYGSRWPVDTLLVCEADYEYLTTTEISANKPGFLADFLVSIGLKNIVQCPELNEAFAGNKDGIVMFPRSNEILEASMPGGPKRALPAHFDGWEFVTKYIVKCSGLHVYHPKKIAWAKA